MKVADLVKSVELKLGVPAGSVELIATNTPYPGEREPGAIVRVVDGVGGSVPLASSRTYWFYGEKLEHVWKDYADRTSLFERWTARDKKAQINFRATSEFLTFLKTMAKSQGQSTTELIGSAFAALVEQKFSDSSICYAEKREIFRALISVAPAESLLDLIVLAGWNDEERNQLFVD